MAVLYHQDRSFKERLKEQMCSEFVRSATAGAQDRFTQRREAVIAEIDNWEALVEQAANIRAHTLDHLDEYLATFIEEAEKNGAIVHFAQTDVEAAQTALGIVREVNGQQVVKSKSMVSEEVDLNKTFLRNGIEVTETDLGEWILQLDDWDAPSHIVGPANHKDRHQVYDLFVANGYTGTKDIPEMTQFARRKLREKFLAADVGVTGCNFAIAETGTVSIMTNEGNGRMVTTLPETQIVLMGMERLVPTLSDYEAIMQVFPQSAVGIRTSSYLSLTSGPRKEGELDGPKTLHIIIVDNGRSDILASPYRDMLRCIRCGTCQNVCPVYRHACGQSYGSIYEGPMGVVLTPLLVGYEKAGDLPYASTLCGECSEHCPVKIPLHELILQHRIDMAKAGLTPKRERATMRAAGIGLGGGKRFSAEVKLGQTLLALLAWRYGGDHLDQRTTLPVLENWTAGRNLPLFAKTPFRALAHREGGVE